METTKKLILKNLETLEILVDQSKSLGENIDVVKSHQLIKEFKDLLFNTTVSNESNEVDVFSIFVSDKLKKCILDRTIPNNIYWYKNNGIENVSNKDVVMHLINVLINEICRYPIFGIRHDLEDILDITFDNDPYFNNKAKDIIYDLACTLLLGIVNARTIDDINYFKENAKGAGLINMQDRLQSTKDLAKNNLDLAKSLNTTANINNCILAAFRYDVDCLYENILKELKGKGKEVSAAQLLGLIRDIVYVNIDDNEKITISINM